MLKLKNISKTYDAYGGYTEALKQINLEVNKGDFVAIVGSSGSGKTTLLNVMAGLLTPTEGDMFYDDHMLDMNSAKMMQLYRKEHIGIILQNFSLLNDRNIYANVALPLKIRKIPKQETKKIVEEKLRQVGILEKIKMYPKQLSGGEQQRVAIARALACDADIFLADEPTGALDEENAKQIITILREIANAGKIVIMVTHNKEFIVQCDRTIELHNGQIKKRSMDD